MKVLELENVSKRFSNVIAVDKVSFSVDEGEFFFLLGPSGCGKTTTLKLIGGLEKSDEGIIKIDGTIVNDIPPYKRPTATVFQNWALFPHKKIYDNVAFGLRMKKVPKGKIKNKVNEYLDLVRLKGYENRYPRQLSGGEQQRIALIRALIVEPRILLLDEPLSNLDKRLREEMRVEIKQIQKKLGITTIFVTHDQAEAMSMADQIAIMRDGKIEQIGTPMRIYNNPETEFVAKFIGETNFFFGKVSIRDEVATVKTSSGLLLSVEGKVDVSEGAEVKIFVRPEDIKILEEKIGARGTNVFDGKIIERAYMGPYVRYYVRLDNENTLFVDEKKVYPIGSKVKVKLTVDRSLCFIA